MSHARAPAVEICYLLLFRDFHSELKVSKSQKQIMKSRILSKNQRDANSTFLKEFFVLGRPTTLKRLVGLDFFFNGTTFYHHFYVKRSQDFTYVIFRGKTSVN